MHDWPKALEGEGNPSYTVKGAKVYIRCMWVVSTGVMSSSLRKLRLSKFLCCFFLAGYAILKEFSYLFGTKFTGQKLYQ